MSRLRCRGRWLAVLAFLCVLAGTTASAEHQERKRIRRDEVVRMEERWRTAQMNGDAQAMDKLLSDQFLGITASGEVVTKAQQLKRVRDRALVMRRLDVEDTKIKLSGNLAVVTSLANIEGTMDGQPLHGAFRYTRVYQRLPGGEWKITNFEATRIPGSGERGRLRQGKQNFGGDGSNSPPASRAVSGFPPPQS